MSNEDLLNFQASNNYQSYGLLCDALYLKMAEDSLTPDIVIENVASNSEFLELITDDDESGNMTLTAKLENNPFYYIMNMARIYIVGNMAYKVFQEGLLETEISNLDELIEIDVYEDGDAIESMVSIGAGAPSSVGTGGSGTGHDAGTYRVERETNGRDRTKASVQVYQFASGPATQYASYYLTTPYKKSSMGLNDIC